LTLASDSLAGVLDPVQTGDGFHDDGSFIMHRVIAYPGTYGELMVRGMAELMGLLVGTEWDVAENERDRVAAAVDASYAPFVHGGLMLDSVRGRAISRTQTRDADNGFNFAYGLVSLAAGLPDSQADLAQRFRSLAKGWLLSNAYKPLSARQTVQIATVAQVLEDDSIPAGADAVGHFPFPDAERITHRRDGWLYSLAMNSDRVSRFEYMNGENLKGWHTGDGMVQVYLDDDRYQYTDEFWPAVDAKRLPGTTVDTAPLDPGAGGDIDNEPLTGARLSGMVSLRGGDAAEHGLGLAAMELRGHESSMRAHKTWLFLDHGVLAAGSGISTEPGADRTVETVVDNRNLHDPDDPLGAELIVDGEIQGDDLDETVVHEDVSWAHVAGVGGYVFLARPDAEAGQALSTLREDRTGAWRDLNEAGPEDPLTRRFLTLWHDHGVDPDGADYAHLHLPGASAEATEDRADDPGVEILELSPDVHAFRVAGGALASATATLTAVTFFAAGSAAGITVDAPCVVLVLEDPKAAQPLRVAVSDPSRSSAVVGVEIEKDEHHEVIESDERLTVLSTKDGARLLAETGGAHGATLVASLRPGKPAPKQRALLLEPSADATVRGGEHADDNYGGEDTLEVWTAESADDDRRAYVAFDLAEADAEVKRAVLWLNGAIPMDPDDREDEMLQVKVHAHRVDDDWSEPDVTWNTAPEPGEQLDWGWATIYRDWVGVDVTEAVRDASGAVSFVLAQADEGHHLVLDSRESDGRKPILEIVVD
ncbi:MAG: polysaccharide lyase family 8 super-sandwich domain-containing protein, partial [Stackebrandtia sp.]